MKQNNNKKAYELIAFSAAALYLELAIIRFTAAEVLYLGYFSNFVLITSFVGLGLGFLSVRGKYKLDKYISFSLLFLFSLVLISQFDVNILRNHFGLFYFGNVEGRAGLPGALLLLILFIVIVILFAGIGSRIAIAFRTFKSLQAYSLDIIGSLFGILLFSLQSIVASGPITWVITGCLLLLMGYLCSEDKDNISKITELSVSGICVVVLLLSSNTGVTTIWSAYQKLEYVRNNQNQSGVIFANSIVHQFLNPAEGMRNTYYLYPYNVMDDLDRHYNDVLIIGAGAGTDVAVSLDHNVRSVDAVEIDARILDIGIKHHPNRPYSDKRVNIYTGDGRQFLKRTTKQYDLIIFALPDSLMRLSAMSSVRLESYLFTIEAFQDVKKHLRDDGIFAMYNQYRWQWLVNKLSASLESIFDSPPLQMQYRDTTVLMAGAGIKGKPVEWDGFIRLATDDWPFVYMKEPGLHWLYLGMIFIFLLASFTGVHYLGAVGTLRHPDYPFFFMGMAFLLLETKSISFFSLLFGTTWVVNAIAFSGILLSVLVANLLVQYFNIRARNSLYAGLFICLLIAYIIPSSVFLNINSLVLRYILSVMLVFSPIFFANLIFSREFKDVEESTRAFGWNLLGAVAGGGLEYLSLMIGYRNLLWIVAVCYLLTALTTYLRQKTSSDFH